VKGLARLNGNGLFRHSLRLPDSPFGEAYSRLQSRFELEFANLVALVELVRVQIFETQKPLFNNGPLQG